MLVFGSASPVSSPPEEEAAEEGEAEDEGQHDQGDGEGGQLAWNLRPWKRNDRKLGFCADMFFTGCSSGLLVLVV